MKQDRLILIFVVAVLGVFFSALAPIPSEAGTPPYSGIRIDCFPAQSGGSCSLLTRAQHRVDDFSASDVSGVSGEPVPLRIMVDEKAPSNDLFAFAGLPEGVILSAGGELGGLWIVPRKQATKLSIISSVGVNASFFLSITRSEMPGRPARTLRVRVTLTDPNSRGKPAQKAPQVVEPHAATPNERIVFDKALAQFLKGDVSSARVTFEYLAARGNAIAALALGETFDPLILQKINVQGVGPDKDKAIKWYREAQRLGDQKAKERLEALASR